MTSLTRRALAYMSTKDFGGGVILLLVGMFVYRHTLSIWAYCDDMVYLRNGVRPFAWPDILVMDSFKFRPLDPFLFQINVALVSYESTLIIHLAGMLGFGLCIILIVKIMRALEPGCSACAMLAAAYFIVSPTNVLSVTQPDGSSQQYATVFALALVWWLFTNTHRPPFVYHAGAFVLGLGSLASKASCFGVIVAAPMAIYLIQGGEKRSHARKRLVISYGVSISLFLIYMLLRTWAGSDFGSSDSSYHLSFSLSKITFNAFMLLSSLLYAGSSLDIFPYLHKGRLFFSLIATLGLLSLSGIGLWYIWRVPFSSRKDRYSDRSLAFQSTCLTVVGLLLLLSAGLFPVVLIGKMSEMYTYSSSTFYALLLGVLIPCGIVMLQTRFIFHKHVLRVIEIFLVLALLWMAYGTTEKVSRSVQVSERNEQHFYAVMEWLEHIPEQHGTLCWKEGQPENEGESTGLSKILTPKSVNPGEYSTFFVQDSTLLWGNIFLANELLSKNVEYLKTDHYEAQCEYFAFISSYEKLSIIQHEN